MGLVHRLPLPSCFLLLLLLLIPNFASSDLAKDKQDCAPQLTGLAPCLSYVGGQAKTPSIDCCTGLKQVMDNSKKCLCLLIKDRNEPDLGLTINASLAASLPSACHVPANISHCIDLLHLAPNSSDAKVFEGFDKAAAKTNSSSSTSASTPAAPTGKGSSPSTSADEKNGGVSTVAAWEKRSWLVAQVVGVITPLVLTFLV
ncbi:non-specific lipid transfer protein GPI-anchored 13-like [Prosopis cineraria]|uniref:non-specific lipid transfer protein GPI-anchored 13-like n=1 Tax=Prosopis cineraria TaxID=364024 RepID=UPI002410354D|nr:non-specific lipid transfer protein GPI-anchored 13-like [Prosopis cineraria]